MESRNPILRRQNATVGFNEPTGVAATPPPPNATPEQLQEMYNQPPAVGATVTIDDVTQRWQKMLEALCKNVSPLHYLHV